jgi:hypothetical protein
MALTQGASPASQEGYKRTPPLPKKGLSRNLPAKEAWMSLRPGIGDAAKTLHTKLTHQLAGPLLEFLPDSWIQQALEKIGHRFRRTAFSPLGHLVGVRRPGARSGSFLQPRLGGHPVSPRRLGIASAVLRHGSLLQGAAAIAPIASVGTLSARGGTPGGGRPSRTTVVGPVREGGRWLLRFHARHAG